MGSSKTISGRFVSLFHLFVEEGASPGSDLSPSSRSILVASTGRIYLRWVYLRTKWFLFGPPSELCESRRFCCRHRRRLKKESETGQQEQRRATRWRRTSTCSSSSWPLSTFPPTPMTFACVRLCNCPCMCVRPT